MLGKDGRIYDRSFANPPMISFATNKGVCDYEK